MKRGMKTVASLLCLAFTGCAKDIIRDLPGGCVSVESRTSMFNTQGAIMCFGEDGQLTGMTGGRGTALIEVPLSLIGPISTISGAVILGKGLKDAAKGMKLETTHTLDVEGVEIPDGIEDEIRGGLGDR